MADDATTDDVTALKAQIADLEARVVTLTKDRDKAVRAKQESKLSATEKEELDALRQAKADAEAEQQRKAGEFEKLEARLTKEKDEALQAAEAARQRFADKVVETAFYGATDLFGPQGRTTLTPDFALPAFRQHVKFVPGENGHDGRVVVHDLKGEPILVNGDPAPFAAGMAQLIDQWPTKDAILRAAPGTGSGSTGTTETINYATATRAELVQRARTGDQDALKALREHTPPGTVHSAPAFERTFKPQAPH